MALGESVTEATSCAEFHLNYVTEPMNIPIYIAASAPKILQMSGRIADGVIVLVGTAPHFIEAALNRDYTLVMGTVVVIAVFIIVFNLLVDLLYAALDPRVRYD